MPIIVSKHPDALRKSLPVIRRVGNDRITGMIKIGLLQPGTEQFKMGKATILVSPPTEHQGWHLSISRPDHYPEWDEIVAAWYGLVPDASTREGMLVLPKLQDYINVHENCFHVHEVFQTVEHDE